MLGKQNLMSPKAKLARPMSLTKTRNSLVQSPVRSPAKLLGSAKKQRKKSVRDLVSLFEHDGKEPRQAKPNRLGSNGDQTQTTLSLFYNRIEKGKMLSIQK